MSLNPRELYDQGRLAELPTALERASAKDLQELPPRVFTATLSYLLDAEQGAAALKLDQHLLSLGCQVPLMPALANQFIARGDLEAALNWIEQRPKHMAAGAWDYVARVNALVKIEQYKLAEGVIDDALECFPNESFLLPIKAQIAFSLYGPTNEVIALFQRAARTCPPKQSLRFNRFVRLLREEMATVAGFEISVPRSLATPVIAGALLEGNYEATERGAAVKDVQPNDRILELGAGLGLVALTVQRACPGVTMQIVEANPELAPVLRSNLALNKCQAEVIEGIAALKDGEGEFHLAADFYASSTQLIDGETKTIRRRSLNTNRLIQEFDPTVLIMDIEGGEITLLPHLDLTGIRRLIIEFHPRLCPPEEISSVIAHLVSSGFAVDLAQGSKQVLVFDRLRATEHD